MSDLISKEAVIEELKTDYSLIMFDSCGNLTFTGERIIEAIKRVPSFPLARHTGEWKEVYAETDYQNGWIEFTCENCKYQHGLESGEYDWHFGDPIPWKYCPMCGARMEEET